MAHKSKLWFFIALLASAVLLSTPSLALAAIPNLNGYYPLDEITAKDVSGNNRNGANFNATLSGNCQMGGCLGFNNTSSYLTAPIILPTGDFTYTAWIYLLNNTDEALFSAFDGSAGSGWEVLVWINGASKLSVTLNNAGVAISNAVLPINTWTHIAITRQSGIVKVYINGAVDVTGTNAAPLTFGTCPLVIGTDAEAGCTAGLGNWFNGNIDEVKIFDRALTGEEITADFNKSFAGASCSPADTFCYPGLECDTTQKKCVPTVDNRAIGTYCAGSAHCDTRQGFLELTCDKDRLRCVGASRGVSCEDSALNINPIFGDTIKDNITPPYRCDPTSLICNENGECARDLGGEFVEEIGVGESSEDIRDQIRRILNLALGFLGIAGVIIVIYGGVLWMTAMGEDDKVEKGKKTIIAGLIGIAIIAIAWTIVSYILNLTRGVG